MKHLWEYQINDSLPIREWYPCEIQLRQFAEASGDFNPVHLDDAFAQTAGFQGVTAHGMLIMAQLGAMVSNWIGDEGTVRSFRVQLENEVYTGKRVVFAGSVKEIRPDFLICNLTANTADGDRVLSGSAVIGFKE